MNEKLSHYVHLLFRAVPNSVKAEEMKEELLANLNEKYEDLVRSGYDSTTAFHIALSGIGDPEELLRECEPSIISEKSTPPEQRNELPVSTQTLSEKPAVLPLVILAVVIMILGPTLLRIHARNFPFMVSMSHLCIAVGIGVIAFAVARRSNAPENQSPQAPSFQPERFSATHTKDEITFKRIVAGILAICLGVFGVHKFYLGFTGAGLTMLLLTVLSLFVLAPITAIISFVEGLLYLLKTDQDFYQDYEVKHRAWF